VSVPVTVLMPAYNAERFVGKTIESVLAQSFRDYEFLIVDDGSKDGTAAVLAEYAARDPRIRVLSQENRGVGRTIDRGLNEAQGELIAIIEADDLMLPGRLAKQFAFMNEHPDYVVCGGYLRIIDPDDRPIGMRKYPLTDEALRARMVMYDPLGHPSLMFRRADALACGSYTARFWTGSDYDFLLRLTLRGRMANFPEPLTAYRFHPNSIKSQQTLKQLGETLRIKRCAYKELGWVESPVAKLVNFAQDVLTKLPGGFVYWLFTRLFIRRDASAGS
jgi:glycosyltransferase involved in cell wall biosynthesis